MYFRFGMDNGFQKLLCILEMAIDFRNNYYFRNGIAINKMLCIKETGIHFSTSHTCSYSFHKWLSISHITMLFRILSMTVHFKMVMHFINSYVFQKWLCIYKMDIVFQKWQRISQWSCISEMAIAFLKWLCFLKMVMLIEMAIHFRNYYKMQKKLCI